MKHLVIKNFGPLSVVDIDLGYVNLIIGSQSSGKSCVMMTACYCTWVEKRIMLRQSAADFLDGDSFINGLITYYHANGYVHDDTYIEYATEYMTFGYSHTDKEFHHKWGNRRWFYKRPKVSYVPAERNLISLVSNWDRFETSYDNILEFKADWDEARKYVKKERNILGTGISYEYDETSGRDTVVTSGGKRIGLVNSSSGIQSLIPQIVHLDYLQHGIYERENVFKEKTYPEKQMAYHLLNILYRRNFRIRENSSLSMSESEVVQFDGKDFVFLDHRCAVKFKREARHLLETDHSEIFMEEPELNLFPPTQFQLMDKVIEMAVEDKRKNFFFIATHSPYVLNYLLQESINNFRLFLTYPHDDGYVVKTASEEDIQDIYDNGSDSFFNFDAFVKL